MQRSQPRFWGMVVFILLSIQGVQAQTKPIRVFILAGQSNMEGHARIETFDYIGDDPATAPLLREMRDGDGKPTVCDGAWISYLTGAGEDDRVLAGKLTAGYGSLWGQEPGKLGEKIGPEFTFGLAMYAAFEEPALLIKASPTFEENSTSRKPKLCEMRSSQSKLRRDIPT